MELFQHFQSQNLEGVVPEARYVRQVRRYRLQLDSPSLDIVNSVRVVGETLLVSSAQALTVASSGRSWIACCLQRQRDGG